MWLVGHTLSGHPRRSCTITMCIATFHFIAWTTCPRYPCHKLAIARMAAMHMPCFTPNSSAGSSSCGDQAGCGGNFS